MVKVRIPATTANLGPGFDTLGMALNLYNYVEIDEIDSELKIEVFGDKAELISKGKDNIVYKAIKATFEFLGYEEKGLHIKLTNEIPIARGLGSSAAAIVGGICAANYMTGNKLSKDEILAIATKMEGHPDNVAPAIFGGLAINSSLDEKIISRKIEVPEKLQAVVAIPRFTLETKVARNVLPKEVSMQDAIFNIGQTALVTYAFSNGEFDLLKDVMNDRLHQPYRMGLIPGMKDVFVESLASGAVAVALSGAGPTLIALSYAEKSNFVGEKMKEAFIKNEVESDIKILKIDNKGVILL